MAGRPKTQKTPTPAGFALPFGAWDTRLPIYTIPHAPFFVFGVSDLAGATGWPLNPDACRCHMAPAGYLSASSLVTVVTAQPDATEQQIKGASRLAHITNSIVSGEAFRVAEILAKERPVYAEGLRLNNQGHNGQIRCAILARMFPDFDPSSDDIWHAANERLVNTPMDERLKSLCAELRCFAEPATDQPKAA
jgi:hypothetical protein